MAARAAAHTSCGEGAAAKTFSDGPSAGHVPGITCPNSVDARHFHTALRCGMQTTNFRIVPLPSEVAQAARERAAAGAPDHSLITTGEPQAYPCRHCLRWAEPGEKVVLFPYASIPQGYPYAESGPIFVHAKNCVRYAATEDDPKDFRRHRVLRAYNAKNEMIDAVILAKDDPEAVIAQLLQNPESAFLQARFAAATPLESNAYENTRPASA